MKIKGGGRLDSCPEFLKLLLFIITVFFFLSTLWSAFERTYDNFLLKVKISLLIQNI